MLIMCYFENVLILWRLTANRENIRNVYADRKGAHSRMKQFEQVKIKNNNCQQNLISEVRRQLM